MRFTWWNGAILSGIVLCGTLAFSTRATASEVIVLRTGTSGGVPGACPDADDRWTYNPVAIPQCGLPFRNAPFTPTDFADAAAGPRAHVVTFFWPWWITGLPSDPQARWIAHVPNQYTCNGEVGSILYACPFVVTTPGATSGDIVFRWGVDDRLGDTPGGPNPIGVYVNGVPLNASFSGGDFFVQYSASQTGVPLVPGTNYLYVYQRDTACTTSGLICNVTITVDTPSNPHVLTVTTTDDTDDGVCDATHCSLREAINAANAQAGSDSIRFAIPGAAPFRIQPVSALPVVSTTMTIDATSQAGFAGAPVVEIDGLSAPVSTDGLRVTGSGVSIAGLAIGRFRNGLSLEGGGATVSLCSIGTDAAGASGHGNREDGVAVSSSSNRIGSSAAPNLIAFNGGAGVRVLDPGPQGVRIEGNAIHDNGGLGIDLGPLGPATNDAGDADTGANAGMNFPVLSGATVGSAGLVLAGTLGTTPAMPCHICVYGNASCDASGQGEGAVFLGAFDVTSDAAGFATIAATLPITDLGTATTLSATATDSAGNTSEFSPCLVALPQPTAVGGPVAPREFAVVAGGPASTLNVYLHMPVADHVRVTLHDAGGRRVRTLLDAAAGAGRHVLTWDGRNDRGAAVASGVYFVRAELDGRVAGCRVALAR